MLLLEIWHLNLGWGKEVDSDKNIKNIDHGDLLTALLDDLTLCDLFVYCLA